MVVSNDSESEKPEAPIYIDAEDARAGEIVLRKRWQRWVFIAGLVGIVALLAILRFVAWG
jgi:hypothetical protein